jgi:hypothetical protein
MATVTMTLEEYEAMLALIRNDASVIREMRCRKKSPGRKKLLKGLLHINADIKKRSKVFQNASS